MTSFFGVGGNPFATPVGQKIEQATDGSLASENWALNMEICDIINDTEEGPKDAIKALRKRLQQNAGKNYTVVMYTLTVLETCVKNCGKRFHVLVCNKEFVQELVKLIEPSSPSWLHATPWLPSPLQSLSLPIHIGPKNDPPTAVQEKVLSLIQSWADAFCNQPEMSGVVHVYQDLKLKGIEFPMTDLDTLAPIHTPQRSIPDGEVPVGIPALVAQQQGSLGSPASSSPTPAAPAPASNVRLTQDQLAKLHGELDVVQANMAVLNEMLSELTPGKEHPSDVQLLRELHATCKAMQQRLVELISKLANDELTAELLRVNDLLNNLFLRYSRFEKNRDLSASGTQPKQTGGTESLIDLTDEASGTGLPQLNAKMANLSVGAGTATATAAASKSDKTDSEFDMFAQSRNVTYETSKLGGSTYEANLKPDQVSGGLGSAVAQARTQPPPQTAMHKESDFDEMAAWLGESAPQESLTSSEFERFLAERAAAAEATPPTNTTQQSTPRHRRPNKDSEDASLFAL